MRNSCVILLALCSFWLLAAEKGEKMDIGKLGFGHTADQRTADHSIGAGLIIAVGIAADLGITVDELVAKSELSIEQLNAMGADQLAALKTALSPVEANDAVKQLAATIESDERAALAAAAKAGRPPEKAPGGVADWRAMLGDSTVNAIFREPRQALPAPGGARRLLF